jgi:hypothetical protein
VSWLNAEDRIVLRALADVLIPEAEGMPSATSAGVADSQLDQVENWRADLMPLVLRAIRANPGKEPLAALLALEASDPAALDALKLVVAGGYYLSSAVRAALNYDGVQRHPYDATDLPDRLTLELVKPVIARGPAWRQVPARTRCGLSPPADELEEISGGVAQETRIRDRFADHQGDVGAPRPDVFKKRIEIVDLER